MPGSDAPRLSLVCEHKGLAPGLPGIWSTALATLMVLVMLGLLLWIVAVNAFGWFWPAAVWQIETDEGRVFIGAKVGREAIPSPAGADEAHRLQIKVGNRDLTGTDFVWIDEDEIVDSAKPDDLVRIVRSEYGDAFGRITGAHLADGPAVDVDQAADLDRLLATGREWRSQRSSLESRLSEARRPLTQREEELDLLERSSNAKTAAGQEQIATLSAMVEDLSEELRPSLDEIQGALDEIVNHLATSHLEVTAGDAVFEVPLSNVIEVTWPNRMGLFAKVWAAARSAPRNG